MITIKHKGDFKKTKKYFSKSLKISKIKNVDIVAKNCVEKLKEATPKDSGVTAESWTYTIIRRKKSVTIEFINTNIQNGVNIALLLEYGHGTSNGGWVEGKEYIEPTIRSAYLEILNKAWEDLEDL